MVFMMFDPHKGEGPLLELIFDLHPTQLANLSLVSDQENGKKSPLLDEGAAWDGYIHWAEYCLHEHTTKLLVLGRAPCDATDRDLANEKKQVFENMKQLLTR